LQRRGNPVGNPRSLRRFRGQGVRLGELRSNCLADIPAADMPVTGNVKAGEPLIPRGAVNIFGLWGRLRRWLGGGGSEPGAHPLRWAALTCAWPMVILKLAHTPGRVASPLIRRFLLGRRFQQASSGVVIQASTRGRSRTFRTR